MFNGYSAKLNLHHENGGLFSSRVLHQIFLEVLTSISPMNGKFSLFFPYLFLFSLPSSCCTFSPSFNFFHHSTILLASSSSRNSYSGCFCVWALFKCNVQCLYSSQITLNAFAHNNFVLANNNPFALLQSSWKSMQVF